MKISKGIMAVVVFWIIMITVVSLVFMFPLIALATAIGVAALGVAGIWSYLIWDMFKDKGL